MATRKALDAETLVFKKATAADPFRVAPDIVARDIAASRLTLERSAQHFAEQDTIDALAATVRRLIPRWLRALLPVAAIARAVARFVEKTLDPYADDPKPDA